MAETKYTYSVASDTPTAKVHASSLRKEIEDSSIATIVNHIIVDDDTIDVYMADALSGGDQTTLDGVLAAHGGAEPAFEPTKIEDNVATSSTSSTYLVISGMTITPDTGDYLVFFSAHGGPSSKNANACFGIFIDGVMVDDSERIMDNGGSHNHALDIPISTIANISVTGIEVIDVRYKIDNGTFNIGKRSLNLVKME